MMRWAPLILLGLLTACSHTPQWPADDRCAQAMAPSGLLQVRSDRGRHNLVVHREPNAEGITYVALDAIGAPQFTASQTSARSEEHTSELQSRGHLVCRLLLEKKKTKDNHIIDITRTAVSSV